MKNKLTKQEQEEILAYIGWKSGRLSEPDWSRMPQWLVDLHHFHAQAEALLVKIAVLCEQPEYNFNVISREIRAFLREGILE